jgi:hypothetical protein
MAVFYVGASLSGAFSGLLAFAIEKMDGIGGLAGWRWYIQQCEQIGALPNSGLGFSSSKGS